MKKKFTLILPFLLFHFSMAQTQTVLQVNTPEGAPIPYARVKLTHATQYSTAFGEVTLPLEIGDSLIVDAFGFGDTTLVYHNAIDRMTVVLWPKRDTLTGFHPKTAKKNVVKVGGNKSLLQREPSDIRMVQVHTKHKFIDSLVVLVHETFLDGAGLRAVVYNDSQELLNGPVVPIPKGHQGLVALPISGWLGEADSLLVGIEFINTNITISKKVRTRKSSADARGVLFNTSNGITLNSTIKAKKNELWVYGFYRNGKFTITEKATHGFFFAAPYMEIYFTAGR